MTTQEMFNDSCVTPELCSTLVTRYSLPATSGVLLIDNRQQVGNVVQIVVGAVLDDAGNIAVSGEGGLHPDGLGTGNVALGPIADHKRIGGLGLQPFEHLEERLCRWLPLARLIERDGDTKNVVESDVTQPQPCLTARGIGQHGEIDPAPDQ